MPLHPFRLAFVPGLLAAVCAATNPADANGDALDRRIDPLLRFELRESGRGDGESGLSASPRVAQSGSGVDAQYACWVRLEPGTSLPSGLALRSYGDGVASGRLRLDEIQRIATVPGVLTIEAARHARPYLDLSVPEIGATEAHGGTGSPPAYGGYTGAGTIIGIVDTGLDLTHEDFLLANSTRVLALWDQTSASINPPASFGYGREWTPAEIDGGFATQTDSEGHGTHVAGTAAGSGAATGNGEPAYQFVGVAPGASLVVVKTDFYTSSIVDAVEYVFAQAAALGLPAVVNLSLGHQYGPHDGTEATDLAIDALVGPGRVVVAAAGNEQEEGIHAEALVARGETDEIRLDIGSYVPNPGADNDVLLIDGYYSQTEKLTVTVVTPNGHTIGPVVPSATGESATPDGSVLIENDVFDPATVDHNVHIQIWDASAGSSPEPGAWRVLLENSTSAPFASEAQVDFWLYYETLPSAGAPSFDPSWGMTASKVVGSPATADSVIAVAAYVTRSNWRSVDGNTYAYNPTPTVGAIAPFSSNGPRRDGVMKPDIAAPGMGIGAALSASHGTSNAWVLEDGVHFITQGTSMACPHVAGVIALMFEAYGPLSSAQVLSKLADTARVDGSTGAVPNPAFGRGKVDALSALLQPTPVLLLGLEVRREEEGIRLSWSVPESLGSARFLVERSEADGSAANGERRVELGVTGSGPEYEFVDPEAPMGTESYYWLTALQDRAFVLGPFVAPAGSFPAHLALSPPAPNPFTSKVSWNLSLPEAGRVTVDLVDAAGRRVTRLAECVLPAGTATYSWDGRDASGDRVASGVYFIRAEWNHGVRTGRVLLVR